MKGLNQFMTFNWDAFAEGKTFVVTGVSEYQDFNTKAHLGTKIECVIASDNTKYDYKNGERFSNRFEKITFKVCKDVSIPLDTLVKPINTVATIYGDFRNQLSVKCENIVPIMQKEK